MNHLSSEQVQRLAEDVRAKIVAKESLIAQSEGEITIRIFRRGAGNDKRVPRDYLGHDSDPMLLAERDQKMVDWIFSIYLVTTEQRQSLFFTAASRSRCHHRLTILYRNRYIDRLLGRPVNAPDVYYISRRSIRGVHPISRSRRSQRPCSNRDGTIIRFASLGRFCDQNAEELLVASIRHHPSHMTSSSLFECSSTNHPCRNMSNDNGG